MNRFKSGVQLIVCVCLVGVGFLALGAMKALATPANQNSGSYYLESLNLSGVEISPAFRKTTGIYSASVGQEVTSIEVNAISEDPEAQVLVTGADTLIPGSNKIVVKVTAVNGAKKEYIITIAKAGKVAINNASLKSLTIKNFNLEPTFDVEISKYVIEVSADTDKLDIEAIAENEKSTVEIIGAKDLKAGENLVVITVTAEDGTVKEYRLTVIRPRPIPKAALEYRKGFSGEVLAIGVGALILIAVIAFLILRRNKRKKRDIG